MNNEIKNKYNEIAESIGNLLESIGDELNGMGSELSLNQKDDITEIVREEVENIDIDDKVCDALDNNSEIMNRDNVDEAISDALYDHDWSQVISDEDLVRNYDLDERIKECFDDRMFYFFRNMMVKVFENDMNDWRTRLENAAVNRHIAKENEAKEKEAKEESPVLTPEQV
tara:strand:+ start:1459 stop:1971 length:513 start_codon:yes stop_codon:yes gene_type:complete